MLQTVKVPVKGKKRVVDAIILFDTGSNRTYVSQNFVDKVSPEWIENQQLSYSSFGAESSSPTENVNIYNMCLQGEKGECSVSATCIKTICSNLSQPRVPSHLLKKIQRMLDLLEGCDSQGQIVFLVGLIFFMMMMKLFSLVEETNRRNDNLFGFRKLF